MSRDVERTSTHRPKEIVDKETDVGQTGNLQLRLLGTCPLYNVFPKTLFDHSFTFFVLSITFL